MFKNTKNKIMVGAAVLLALSMAGCTVKEETASTAADKTTNAESGELTGESVSKGDASYKIAYCTKRWSGSEHWITVKEGIDSVIRPEDDYIFVDCNGDLDAQVKALEDLVAQGVDAIICSPRDPDGVVAAFEKVHEAGVKLICLDCSSSAPQFQDACVKMDYYSTGELCAEHLMEAIGQKGKVLMYYDFPNVEANERADGFRDVASKCSDVKLVEIDGFGTLDEALLKLEDALIANPDTVAIWGYNTQSAQAAISLLESMNMDCLVTCVDATSIEVENIRAGRQLGGAAQFPYEMGAMAAETVYKILDGEDISGDVLLESEWVDSSNVDEFAAKMGFDKK